MKTQTTLFAWLLIVSVFILACGSGSLSEPTPISSLTTPTLTLTPIPLPSETPIPTQAPIPVADETHDSIVNALLALYIKSNRMNVTTVLDDGQTYTTVVEFVPPDRKHIISVDEDVEYIVIGEDVYAKTSGNWGKTEIPAATFMGDAEITAEAISETISNVKLLRNDMLDGIAVHVYGYDTNTMAGGIELHSQAELWVGVNDRLPYKMVVDGETYSASTDPATGESKIIAVKALMTTLINFEPTISIQPPVH